MGPGIFFPLERIKLLLYQIYHLIIIIIISFLFSYYYKVFSV